MFSAEVSTCKKFNTGLKKKGKADIFKSFLVPLNIQLSTALNIWLDTDSPEPWGRTRFLGLR